MLVKKKARYKVARMVVTLLILLFFIKTPVQIKEFGAVSKVDFSPQPPYNYAVTASSRVNVIFFFYIVYIYCCS